MSIKLRGSSPDHYLIRAPRWRALGAQLWALSAVASIATGALPAQDPEHLSPADRVIEHELENGWRFLIYPRRAAPVVSFETYVAVGTADDPAGRGGMTELVKNLMFKGSSRIGTKDWTQEQLALAEMDEAHAAWLSVIADGSAEQVTAALASFERSRARAAEWVLPQEFSSILEGAGSGDTLGAFSDQKSTRFVVSLPANQVELWCWMESERFRDPVFREFYGERAALLESWQSDTGRDATQLIGDALRACAYGESPLGRPTRAAPEELQLLDRAAAIAFFREHYGAGRVVTAIVGDVDLEQLIPLLNKYFGALPRGPKPAPISPAARPSKQPCRVQVPFAGEPMLWIGWPVPPAAHPDSPAIEVALRLLGNARSSRLEKRIKRSSTLVSSLELHGRWGGDAQRSLALCCCTLNLGAAAQDLEQAIYDEIGQLAREGPSREELAGVKRVASAEFYRSLRHNDVLAAGLASALVMTGHWRSFFEREKRLGSVQPREVQRVLSKWFGAEHRTVALLLPKQAEAAAQKKQDKPDEEPPVR